VSKGMQQYIFNLQVQLIHLERMNLI